jgi:hypothetical protein
MSNSITKIVVRDTDAKADTAIELPLTGGTIYESQLPKNWALSAYFQNPPEVTATITGVGLSVDGQAVEFQESAPYTIPNKHPGLPLNLSTGSHTLTVSHDGTSQSFGFTVATAPAQPQDEVAVSFGTNFEGANDKAGSPIEHPELLKAVQAAGMDFVRFWQIGSLGGTWDTTQTIPAEWHKLGYSTICVLNFQNSPQRCKAVPVAEWTTYLNSIPENSVTGITHFEIGNEIDFAVYWSDTMQNYFEMVKIAYPILKSKGYQVIMANCLNNLNAYVALNSLGAFQYCDFVGRHAYQSSAVQALAAIDAVITFAATVKKGVICTEGGIRGSSTNFSAWAALVKDFYTGLKSRAGAFLQFPAFTLSSDTLDIGSLLNPDYSENKNFYPAITQAMV